MLGSLRHQESPQAGPDSGKRLGPSSLQAAGREEERRGVLAHSWDVRSGVGGLLLAEAGCHYDSGGSPARGSRPGCASFAVCR